MEPQKYYRRQARAYRLRRKLHNLKIAWRDILRREPAAPLGSSSPMSLLPTDILLDILDNLPPRSRACLALACKALYDSVQHALVSPRLRHLPDAFPDVRVPLRRKLLNDERWALIRLLQDDRWLACSACFKLHPFTDFRPNQIFEQDHSRICHMGLYTGFVDPCPCSKMTFQDKLRLVEVLEQSRTAHPIFKPEGGGRLWHRCSQSYGRINFQTSMTPRIGGDGDLILLIEYMCTWQGNFAASEQQEPIPRRICPHESVMQVISELLNSSGRPFPSSYWECQWCRTTCSMSAFAGKGLAAWRCKVTRNLGKARDIPDESWSSQNALSQDDDVGEYAMLTEPDPSLSLWDFLFTIETSNRWASPVHAH